MVASNMPTSADSGFISGDMFAALHVDYLSDNLFDDLSDAIDLAVSEESREFFKTLQGDVDWSVVAPLLRMAVRDGELNIGHSGGADVTEYVNSLEFGDQERPPTALLRKTVRRAADNVTDKVAVFMNEEVSLG